MSQQLLKIHTRILLSIAVFSEGSIFCKKEGEKQRGETEGGKIYLVPPQRRDLEAGRDGGRIPNKEKIMSLI